SGSTCGLDAGGREAFWRPGISTGDSRQTTAQWNLGGRSRFGGGSISGGRFCRSRLIVRTGSGDGGAGSHSGTSRRCSSWGSRRLFVRFSGRRVLGRILGSDILFGRRLSGRRRFSTRDRTSRGTGGLHSGGRETFRRPGLSALDARQTTTQRHLGRR